MRRPLLFVTLSVTLLVLAAGCGPEKKSDLSTPPSDPYGQVQQQRPRPSGDTPEPGKGSGKQ